jgi:ketosteroid isomerase-like protein
MLSGVCLEPCQASSIGSPPISESPASGDVPSPDRSRRSADSESDALPPSKPHLIKESIVNSNERAVRNAYAIAEARDIQGWIDCFTPDGVFVDNSIAVTYRGPTEVALPVEYYGAAFSDMHRELYDIYVSGDVVVVQLALQGTHDGALHLPFGMLPATGERMDAPCCDVFTLVDGKIKQFDCYPEASVILSQLGVLSNMGAVLEPLPA